MSAAIDFHSTLFQKRSAASASGSSK